MPMDSRFTKWWQIWVCLLIVAIGLLIGGVRSANLFLSVNRPVAANILVVEGWLPDYGVQQGLDEFRNGHYEYLVTVGGPLEQGSFLSGYGSYAAIAGATLRELGFPGDRLIEAPAAGTLRNRTFEGARSVRAKLSDLGIRIQGLNVVSGGLHARRTRLAYRRVFGRNTNVGVIAVAPRDYDPDYWWKSSEGVKSVLGEALGWAYELVFNSGR